MSRRAGGAHTAGVTQVVVVGTELLTSKEGRDMGRYAPSRIARPDPRR